MHGSRAACTPGIDGDVRALPHDARPRRRHARGAHGRQPLPLHRLPADPRRWPIALPMRPHAVRRRRRLRRRRLRRWRLRRRRRRCHVRPRPRRRRGGGGRGGGRRACPPTAARRRRRRERRRGEGGGVPHAVQRDGGGGRARVPSELRAPPSPLRVAAAAAGGGSWWKPTTLTELLLLRQAYPAARIVVGNTEVGIESRYKGARPTRSSARPPSGAHRVRRWRRRHDLGAAASLADVEKPCGGAAAARPGRRGEVARAVMAMLGGLRPHRSGTLPASAATSSPHRRFPT